MYDRQQREILTKSLGVKRLNFDAGGKCARWFELCHSMNLLQYDTKNIFPQGAMHLFAKVMHLGVRMQGHVL